MRALYDPKVHPALHARVLAALPGTSNVHYKVGILIPGRVWPHVVAAKEKQAAELAVAEADRRAEDELGIGMPAPAATVQLCTAWMKSFVSKCLIEEGPRGWRFVDYTFTAEAAKSLVARVCHWKQKAAMTAACNAFETKVRCAYLAAFDLL